MIIVFQAISKECVAVLTVLYKKNCDRCAWTQYNHEQILIETATYSLMSSLPKKRLLLAMFFCKFALLEGQENA